MREEMTDSHIAGVWNTVKPRKVAEVNRHKIRSAEHAIRLKREDQCTPDRLPDTCRQHPAFGRHWYASLNIRETHCEGFDMPVLCRVSDCRTRKIVCFPEGF